MALRNLLTGAAAAALLSLPVTQPGNLPLGATAVQAQEKNVSIDVFFDALSDYGQWVKNPTYRYVWVPNDVPNDWAPYTRGHWANTDRFGWTFVSDEPFAWAVYHYGRWGYDRDLGWFWVPGTEWAPAWVSWRRGHDTVGWAPLPPEGEGFATTTEISSQEPPRGYWHFVRARQFLEPDLATVIIRDETPYDETQVVGPVQVQNNIVVDNSIDVDFIQQATGRRVETRQVQVVRDPTEARQAARQGTVFAFEGQLAKPGNDLSPPKAVEPKQVKAPTVGQNVDTTTGSINRGQQTLPNEQAPGAGQATGGQRAGNAPGNQPGKEQPNATAPGGQTTDQERAAKGETGQQNGGSTSNKKLEEQNKGAQGATGQENGATANTKRLQDQNKAARSTTGEQNGAATNNNVEEQNKGAQGATGQENGATANTKKLQDQNKAAKGNNNEEQSGSAKSNNATEEQGQARQEQPKTRHKMEQGTGETQSGQAPAGKSDRSQAQGTQEETGANSAHNNNLKKQPGAQNPDKGTQGAQSQESTRRGAAGEQGQTEAQSAPGKGPRRLQQGQSDETTTGAISGGKRHGAQGGVEQRMKPEGAAPEKQGKTKGCSAEQQSAGSC